MSALSPRPVVLLDIDHDDPVCDACGDALAVDCHQAGVSIICGPCREEFFPPSFPDVRMPGGNPMSVDAFIKRGAA